MNDTPLKPVLFLKAQVKEYTRKDGTVVAAHQDSRPDGQWYVHHVSKDGVEEHRKVISRGKPTFAGSGVKMRKIIRYPGHHMEVYHEHGGGPALWNSDDVDAAKAHLDRGDAATP